MRRLLLVLALCLSAFGAVPAAVAIAPVAFSAGHGITVVSAIQSDARTWRLVVSTAQLSRPVRVNVLLPDGYGADATRYPVLYLFHGTSGGADDWLTQGNAEAVTAGLPLIVVMPDAGYDNNGGSWFTNWVDQQTPLGTANWETFHIAQLVPWIDANLRTVADRSGRAVAGLSQGGFGSTSYAARHPDLFDSVASFSGAPDIDSNPVAQLGASVIIDATAAALDGVEPDAFFGSRLTHEINWSGHNPATLVTNMRGMSINLWSGNGIPGPLDTPGTTTPESSTIEAIVHQSTRFFARAATSAHIRYRFDDYGPGTHTWPYWARDLTQYLPRLMRTFATPPAAPARVSYTSIDATWTQWGWTVSNQRGAAQDWSRLSGADASGFTLTGTGAATVRTPAVYSPGTTYRIRGVPGERTATAGPGGRLTISVSLATPAHVGISAASG
jgi:S-formylglutathione hydrolase FrmB